MQLCIQNRKESSPFCECENRAPFQATGLIGINPLGSKTSPAYGPALPKLLLGCQPFRKFGAEAALEGRIFIPKTRDWLRRPKRGLRVDAVACPRFSFRRLRPSLMDRLYPNGPVPLPGDLEVSNAAGHAGRAAPFCLPAPDPYSLLTSSSR